MSATSLKRRNAAKPDPSEEETKVTSTEKERPTIDDTAADEKADELDAMFDGVDTDDANPEAAQIEVVNQVPASARPANAVAVRPAMSVAQTVPDAGGAFIGFNRSNLRNPTLKCVQGSSDLKEQFMEGAVIYGDVELLPPPPLKEEDLGKAKKLRFVPVRIIQQFRQNLSDEQQKAGEIPAIVDTLDEVHERGGTIAWIGNSRPSWSPYGTIHMLIESPEDVDDPVFGLDLDGREYALAEYKAGGGAFGPSVQQILNTAFNSLLEPVIGQDGQPERTASGIIKKRPLIYRNFWTFQVKRKKAGEHLVFRPVVKLLRNDQTGEEIRAYCADLLGASAED